MDDIIAGDVLPIGSKYNWKIENFSSLLAATGTPICSPTFHMFSAHGKPLRWRLQLYPNGKWKESNSYIALYLQYLSEVEIYASFSLNLIDSSDEDIFKHISSKEQKFKTNSRFGWLTFVKKNAVIGETKSVLDCDILTVSCTILPVTLSALNQSKGMNCTDSLTYMDTGDFSDVTLSIEDKEIRLHRAVLASVSPVFEKMLKNESQNSVQITDVKYVVMKELFRYIYVRKIQNIEIMAGHLYVAADKYAVDGLKVLCEKTLCDNLNADNALQSLELAVKLNMAKLKLKVIKFVISRLKDFVDKKEFKQLSHDCKNELFSIIANTVNPCA